MRKRRIDKGWALAILALVTLLVITTVISLDPKNGEGSSAVSTLETDNGDIKINWERYPSYEIGLSESLTITGSGTYHLTGKLDDGLIIINTNHETGKVRLILDNVSIINSDGPAIVNYSSDDLIIELVGQNYLEDGMEYSDEYDEDVTGVVYSKDDLTFQGDGRLTLVANYADGIVSKDDLKFNAGTYNLTTMDDSIRGKDSVYIVDGDFTINAKADGIKSTNETTAGKGFILIENGDFSITAGAKGIKAINNIVIYGGDFAIHSYDDAIHTNNYISIDGGEFTIESGDDGVHADKELIVNRGTIEIAKSYEGLEAQAITINGGDISIIASDDGLNAGGGVDSSANNRRGAGMFDADTNCILTINNGSLYINASGDGLDSNGYLYLNGGKVTVDGPTNNGNGALDSGAGIVMNGAEVVAVGSSGMIDTPSKDSKTNSVSVFFDSTLSAGTEIVVKNSAGETVLTHTAKKSFSHLMMSSDALKSWQKYIIYIDGEEYDSFTVDTVITTIGNSMQNMMPGGPMDKNN